MKKLKTHFVIPDTQIKDGVPLEHLTWIGNYIVDEKPDVIIHLGDFADMPSLSSYDRGMKSFEGRRYKTDVEAAHAGMLALMKPIIDYNKKALKSKKKRYTPRFVMLLGNHENRINRAVECDAILEGTISTDDLGYAEWGWEVHPFLDPVTIDGIRYSHFFPRSGNGRILQNRRGSPSARTQAVREMMSCTAGHLQGIDLAVIQTGDRRVYGLIAGSCYLHDEDYLTAQGTHYWRGVVVCHQVKDGEYDPMMVSLDYLDRRYNAGQWYGKS